MSSFVDAVAQSVPASCHASQCSSKEGCSISLDSAPHPRVLINMDCEELRLLAGTRCDYVFVGADSAAVWVAPIELKAGRFKGAKVVQQLRAGARIAARWLPQGEHVFRLVPILAHGPKRVHKEDLRALRAAKITLRNRTRQTVLIKCGKTLRNALDKFSRPT